MKQLLKGLFLILCILHGVVLLLSYQTMNSVTHEYQMSYDEIVTNKDLISRAIAQSFFILDDVFVQESKTNEEIEFYLRVLISQVKASQSIELGSIKKTLMPDSNEEFQDLHLSLEKLQQAAKALANSYERIVDSRLQFSFDNHSDILIEDIRQFVKYAYMYDIDLVHIESLFSKKIRENLGRTTKRLFLIIVSFGLILFISFVILIKYFRGRQETLTKLKTSEDRFKTIFDGSRDGIFLIAKNARLAFVNSAGCMLSGYTEEELLTMRIHDLHAPEDLHAFEQLFERVMEGKAIVGETDILRKDGVKVPLEFSNTQVAIGGKLYMHSIARDISERRKMEKQLQQAQKMESIGNLAGGIAHDFNNILSSIIGYTELALEDTEKGTKLEDCLQEVYTAGERARDLVKQILAFARQSDEEKKPIQVDMIAEESLKIIRSTIPTTIEIRKNLESKSLTMGNATQINQLFINICTNAAQAMEDSGGILAVAVVDVEIDERSSTPQLDLKPGDYIMVTISDTGNGISPDVFDLIFEPYFTTKEAGEGTGMGLALVHGILESHGGRITVSSELGKGATFSIFLPVTQKRDAYQPYEQGELPCGNERVLIIDDEFHIAKISSQILERLGYQVTVRTSSVDALELFRSRPYDFDLIITDMTMPNLTGDILARELIAFRTDIPVILFTGYSKKITDEKAAEIGIKAFAYKPVTRADLAKTVRRVLDEANA